MRFFLGLENFLDLAFECVVAFKVLLQDDALGLNGVAADFSHVFHVGEADCPLHAYLVVGESAFFWEHLAEVVVERVDGLLDLLDGGAVHDAAPLFPDESVFGTLGFFGGNLPVLAFDQEHPVFLVVQNAVYLVVDALGILPVLEF